MAVSRPAGRIITTLPGKINPSVGMADKD
jgi:hypothetical protein